MDDAMSRCKCRGLGPKHNHVPLCNSGCSADGCAAHSDAPPVLQQDLAGLPLHPTTPAGGFYTTGNLQCMLQSLLSLPLLSVSVSVCLSVSLSDIYIYPLYRPAHNNCSTVYFSIFSSIGTTPSYAATTPTRAA